MKKKTKIKVGDTIRQKSTGRKGRVIGLIQSREAETVGVTVKFLPPERGEWDLALKNIERVTV